MTASIGGKAMASEAVSKNIDAKAYTTLVAKVKEFYEMVAANLPAVLEGKSGVASEQILASSSEITESVRTMTKPDEKTITEGMVVMDQCNFTAKGDALSLEGDGVVWMVYDAHPLPWKKAQSVRMFLIKAAAAPDVYPEDECVLTYVPGGESMVRNENGVTRSYKPKFLSLAELKALLAQLQQKPEPTNKEPTIGAEVSVHRVQTILGEDRCINVGTGVITKTVLRPAQPPESAPSEYKMAVTVNGSEIWLYWIGARWVRSDSNGSYYIVNVL